jgi:hypothetical protein
VDVALFVSVGVHLSDTDFGMFIGSLDAGHATQPQCSADIRHVSLTGSPTGSTCARRLLSV